jgi:DNA invertase Pin-like site-specific DNA recombinase
VVWKLDRLARSLKEGVNVLAEWCHRGVRVIAVTQQIDLNRERPRPRPRALKKQGLTIGEIARALGVKERTVYNYLARS